MFVTALLCLLFLLLLGVFVVPFFCSGFSFGWLFALLLFYFYWFAGFAFVGLFGRETERRGMFDALQDVYAG